MISSSDKISPVCRMSRPEPSDQKPCGCNPLNRTVKQEPGEQFPEQADTLSISNRGLCLFQFFLHLLHHLPPVLNIFRG